MTKHICVPFFSFLKNADRILSLGFLAEWLRRKGNKSRKLFNEELQKRQELNAFYRCIRSIDSCKFYEQMMQCKCLIYNFLTQFGNQKRYEALKEYMAYRSMFLTNPNTDNPCELN